MRWTTLLLVILSVLLLAAWPGLRDALLATAVWGVQSPPVIVAGMAATAWRHITDSARGEAA